MNLISSYSELVDILTTKKNCFANLNLFNFLNFFKDSDVQRRVIYPGSI